MFKYIQFDIKALEPLKLGKFERDSNNEYSYSHIPGSVIKGALVWGMVENSGTVPKEILNGDTVFYNAYPLIDGNQAIPMMQGYIGDKQEIRSKKDDIHIIHSFNREQENSIPFTCYEFVTGAINGEKQLLGYNPGKVEKLHINKKDVANNMGKLKMFRYEAIKKGEHFRSYIRIPKERYDDIREILSQDYIYFGGSRGSGYGKCKISNIKDIQSVQLYKSDFDVQDDLYIYFLSDAILYYNGKVNTYIPENELKEILGIKGKCEYVESYSSLGVAASYNTLYRTNTICYSSVLKGSVIRYRVGEKVDPDKIRELIAKGLGLRKEDGYGQVAVLNKIQDDIIVSEYKKDGVANKLEIELTDEDKIIIDRILSNIFNDRSKLQIEKMVIELLEDRGKPSESLQSQIGKLLNIFQNGRYKTGDDFKKYLKDYLEHMQDKKGKIIWHRLDELTISSSFSKSKSERLSIQKLLIDFVADRSNSVFDELENISKKGVTLGKCKFPNSNDLGQVNYNLKVDFFISFFEYSIRMKEEGVVS